MGCATVQKGTQEMLPVHDLDEGGSQRWVSSGKQHGGVPERPGQQQWGRNLLGPGNHRKFVGMQSGLRRSGSPGEAISYL